MKLLELWATLGLDTRDFDQGTRSASGKAQSLGSTIQSSVKASTVAVGNLMSSAVQKVASGFVDMTKQAFDAVATLEQNIGGSEQVFGDYAAEIQNWGKEAFQYVGLSQGEYLGYANRIGSLLQGMGFSQEQSLDLTTDAMQRAADVASIMGIDVSSAMEAIAGAAKGNFTMMDNLGVAINDTALANYALETGITKSVSQMSTQEKVALALEMFLNKTAYAAGNYARENDTLAGSIQTAKAAFENLLAGSGTVDDFVRTVENAARVAFKNLKEIVPRLGQSIVSAGKLFAPKIESILGNLWDNQLPGFVTRGVNGLIDGVNDLLGTNIPHIDTIDLPTWEEFKTSVSSWWETTSTKIKDVTKWSLKLLGIAPWTDDDTQNLRDWWAGIYDTIVGICKWILDPPLPPDADTAIAAITSWWEGVRNSLSLTFSVRPSVGTYQETKESVVNDLGPVGQSFVSNPDSFINWGSIFGSFLGNDADGLDYVPFNGYRTELHAGEAVLTRQEAENWRSGGNGGASADDIAAAVSAALEGKAVVLGDQIVGVLTDRIDRSLSKKTKTTRRYATA